MTHHGPVSTGKVIRDVRINDVQAIKTQLDAEIYGSEGILTPETARAKAAQGRVEGARRELLEWADARSPKYAETRARAGSDFEQDRAAELAKDIDQLSPQEVDAFLTTASKEAAATFRAQAMLRLKDKLLNDSDKSKRPALVRDLWGYGDGKMRAVMQRVFGGDTDKFNAFASAMERELKKVETREFVFGGSQTANKLMEAADLDGGGEMSTTIMQLAYGGPQAAATGAGARLFGRAAARNQAGYLEATRDRIAQNVFDPSEASDDFLRLMARLKEEREAAMRVGGFTSRAAVGVGATGAPPARP